MSRYFRGPITTIDGIRGVLMAELEQPNERASEPWRIGGDFNDGALAYVALGEHHTTGWFAPLVEQFISTPGVEEIDEAAYRAAMPEPELPI